PLRARRDGGHLGAARAAGGGRLEADVSGDQVPARGGLGAHPAGAEVRLREGPFFAADIDADAAEGRFGPGRHRARGGGAAGVEAEAGEDRGADRGGGDRVRAGGGAERGGAVRSRWRRGAGRSSGGRPRGGPATTARPGGGRGRRSAPPRAG